MRGQLSNVTESRYRVGVMFGTDSKLNIDVIRYLILQLNQVQDVLEFECLPAPLEPDPVMPLLSAKEEIDRAQVDSLLAGFLARYRVDWCKRLDTSTAKEDPPERVIIVTLARFCDGLYSTTKGDVSVLALGNWQRHMAPPSLVEFIVFLTLRLAMGLVEPAVRAWAHLGTRGCLWDFNPYLDEVRYKILVGYLCPECATALRRGRLARLVDQLPGILSREWLGKADDAQSPAAICAKLGYNLFTTSGVRPTFREKFTQLLREEAAKEAVKWVFAIILALTLLWLGLEGA